MKLKMSNFKFRLILIPIMAFLFLIIVVGTPIAMYFESSLDTYLGMGDRKVVGGGGSYSKEQTDYYGQKYPLNDKGKLDSSYAAYKVGEEISDEGEVLLKNDGTLPLAKQTKVTPLGFRYVTPVMTGTGSGAATLLQSFVVRPSGALNKYFDVNKKMESVLNGADPTYATAQGYKGKSDNNGTFSGATSSVGEFKPTIYKASDIGDYKTAIVFIGRQGGEGGDLQMTPYYDGATKIAEHQLQLMPYEKQMIAFAELNFDKVVVIVNSPNPMELGSLQADNKINAILWVGTTGSRGFESMGKILCGDVNPSGRLVDTYYRDFKADPTFNNYGYFYYTNDSAFTHRKEEHDDKAHFVEYEEGIYLGYKYYETRFTDEGEYAQAVVYPFGYGLTYSGNAVSQELTEVTYDKATGAVTVKGKVKNDSALDAKEVVQVYFNPPYSTSSKIEKAAKNLVAFEKISVAKNSEKSFEISFAAEDMASYDYKGYYSEGKGSYVLEGGSYEIHIGKNSHDSWDSDTISVEKTIVYYNASDVASPKSDCEYVGKRASDEIVATNQYDYISDYMDGVGEFGANGKTDKLTREDGLKSGTTAPVNVAAPKAVIDQFKKSAEGSFDYDKYITEKYGSKAPKSGADNGLTLSELRGLPYDDEKWDLLLDQLDYSSNEIDKLLGYGAFNTAAVSAIGKGKTNDSDGPQAIGKTGVSDGTGAANAYPAEVVIASTWNKELAEKMGVAIGDEALAQNANGWYAPACNIHRSPFLGRVYEYYSEDAVLSGYMAAYTVQGAASRGFTAFIKHFAVNDQESGRIAAMTWLDEQTLREIYLKPFEMAVKLGKVEEKYLSKDADGTYSVKTVTRKAATAMMTSMNYIGAVWTSLDYTLTTTVLRNEWGFEGAVITDSATPEKNQLNNSIAAGNDYYLTFMSSKLTDKTSAAAQWAIRQAVHNICYAVVNSNYTQYVGPGQNVEFTMSPWKIGLIIGDVVLGALVVGGAVWIVMRTLDEKKHDGKYAKRGKKTASADEAQQDKKEEIQE
ncbi:MAG: glycoside hydrolase family 3 protein [Clostridiales bacterium]|nr:glycoside hydrolase family 3 protein [Clostridiales bacterium]